MKNLTPREFVDTVVRSLDETNRRFARKRKLKSAAVESASARAKKSRSLAKARANRPAATRRKSKALSQS